jgi:hypothetical protein
MRATLAMVRVTNQAAVSASGHQQQHNATGSVVEAWVSFERFWHGSPLRHCTHRLAPATRQDRDR